MSNTNQKPSSGKPEELILAKANGNGHRDILGKSRPDGAGSFCAMIAQRCPDNLQR
jgi:hypothetical protein